MSEQPNIILIMTDQQRFDAVGVVNPVIRTPNLDRLARKGTLFEKCFITSPVCVSSRASLFTGLFPHSTGVFSNFNPWRPSWVSDLAAVGYHCVSIGKMHINPYDDLGGFHQRFVVENKDRPLFLEDGERAFYDELDKALKSRGLVKPSRYTRHRRDPEGYKRALGCFPWELPDEMHPDAFVGDTAKWWIEDRKSEAPLFLQIGFPGPHPPYDPPRSQLRLYDSAQFPIRPAAPGDCDQPPSQKELRRNMIDFNFDSVAWREHVSEEERQTLWRHYAANVTLIDEKIGVILAALEAKHYLENALVIFTSDHGDALGDHGHIQKWTMYDCVTRVPLILYGTGVKRGMTSSDLVQLMDLAPTILRAAGLNIPASMEAQPISLPNHEIEPRSVVYAELGRDHIQTGSELVVMRRDLEWKLVWYLEDGQGELYRISEDPLETTNLWSRPEYRRTREMLVDELRDWLIRSMLASRSRPTKSAQQAMRI